MVLVVVKSNEKRRRGVHILNVAGGEEVGDVVMTGNVAQALNVIVLGGVKSVLVLCQRKRNLCQSKRNLWQSKKAKRAPRGPFFYA